jgi:uncharacterized protein YbjQ (UPF0145 family)
MTSADDSARLPAAAQARMAEIKASGTWGSALSVGEFAAIKAVGFEPAGQVLGAAVYKIGYEGNHVCPTYRVRTEPSAAGRRTSYTAVSGTKGANSFRPLLQAQYAARRAAISRMAAECSKLGGHGVVGVMLTVSPFPAGGLEFKAIGTAVRVPGVRPIRQLFTSELSGQEFATLLMTGFMPIGIVLGISIGVRHDDFTTFDQAHSYWNTEVRGYSELVNRTRRDARDQLRKDVIKHHAVGVVTRAMELRIDEYECKGLEGAKDHVAEATIVGTAITRFGQNKRPVRTDTLAVMSLGERARPEVEIINPMMRSS